LKNHFSGLNKNNSPSPVVQLQKKKQVEGKVKRREKRKDKKKIRGWEGGREGRLVALALFFFFVALLLTFHVARCCCCWLFRAKRTTSRSRRLLAHPSNTSRLLKTGLKTKRTLKRSRCVAPRRLRLLVLKFKKKMKNLVGGEWGAY